MEVTVTTQLENLIVTFGNTPSCTQTQPEEAAAAFPDTSAATLSLGGVCKMERCDDDDDADSKDTVRYLHTYAV